MIETFAYISSELKPLRVHVLDISFSGLKEFEVYPFLRKHPDSEIPATAYKGQVIYCSSDSDASNYARKLTSLLTDISDGNNGLSSNVSSKQNDILLTEKYLDPEKDFRPYKKLIFEALRRDISRKVNRSSFRLKHGLLSISIATKNIMVDRNNIPIEEHLSIRGFNSNLGSRMLLVMDVAHHIPWLGDEEVYKAAKEKTVISCGERYADTSYAIKTYFGDLNRLNISLDNE
ncbi:MAG: hypothetical protein QXU18_12880, partial [Thermoplasmatales archaeon]